MENYKVLSKLRKEHKLKAKDLAKMLNLDPTTISSYERGINEPSIDILAKIAAIYHVSIDYLVLGKRDEINISSEDFNNLLKISSFLLDMKKKYLNNENIDN